MRIAIAGQVYHPGDNGQAIFTIHLAEGLARLGHEVHVFTPSLQFRNTHEVINAVHWHRLRGIHLRWIHPNFVLTIFPALQIRKIFSSKRPDVVHVQDHGPVGLDAARVAQKMKIPLIGTNHFLPENLLPYLRMLPVPNQWKIATLWWMLHWTYDRLDLATAPTETAAGWLRAQGMKLPVLSQTNGVDTHLFHTDQNFDRDATLRRFGLDPQKTTLLYVGRLDLDKRLDLLVQGMGLCKQRGQDNLQLMLVGQGTANGSLQALANSLGLGEALHFLGYIPNQQLPDVYQAADIFGMPSPEEGQSIATLEAMASGRPVLAANARALPELVATGENGFLFESENPASVAEGISFMIARRDQWEQMGKVSRIKAEQHALENSIRNYADLYCRLIGQKNGKYHI